MLLFVFQFIDSDEDNDGYVDTDEEVSNGRVNILNGSGPPYFHGYLYMKSELLHQITTLQAFKKPNRVVVASVLQAFLCFPLVFFLLFMSTLYCIFLTNVVFHVLCPLSPDDACLGVGGSNNINKHPLCLPNSGGLMIPWRRRWCVLKDETFMWFRAKQDSVKSGWLYKKGGGMSTLSRRNWKMRWFVLRESKLMYFENDTEEKLKGTIDVRTAK